MGRFPLENPLENSPLRIGALRDSWVFGTSVRRFKNEKSAQRGSFRAGYPADIQGSFARISWPKTSVRALKMLEKHAFGRGYPWPEGADVHNPKGFSKNFGQKNFGLNFCSLKIGVKFSQVRGSSEDLSVQRCASVPVPSGPALAFARACHDSPTVFAGIFPSLLWGVCLFSSLRPSNPLLSMAMNQNTFDHDKGQKSAIWGAVSTGFFWIFSSECFSFFSRFAA